LDALEVSLVYLFGVSNKATWYVNGAWDDETSDFDATYHEVKGAYQFSETFGAYVLYRCYSYDFGPPDFSGFGAGVQISFKRPAQSGPRRPSWRRPPFCTSGMGDG